MAGDAPRPRRSTGTLPNWDCWRTEIFAAAARLVELHML